MHVSTVHHRQDFDLVCAHALERQIKAPVGVDVRKDQRIHEVTELLIFVLVLVLPKLALQPVKVDHANYTSAIGDQPRSDFTRSSSFQSFPHRDLRRQRLVRSVHDCG